MKKTYLITLLTLALGAMLLHSACTKEEPGPTIDLAAIPYANLSAYNFFEGDLKNMSPTEGVLPYDLNTPLFSDYAAKARFIYLPDGQAAQYTAEDMFDYPVGTIIIKTFYYDNDFRDPSQGRRILETRLLIHKSTGWIPASYIWNEAQDAATFTILSEFMDVEWVHDDGSQRSTNYYMPNKNDCKGCHSFDGKLLPIGPRARNLNKNYDYVDGAMNQLDKWVAMGYLEGVPAMSEVAKAAVWDDPSTGDLNARARAYLDVNCAHCHSPNGPAKNSALFLDFGEEDNFNLGFCKQPIAAGKGSGGRQFTIIPGDPDGSIMPYRMNSNVIDVAMPELGRTMIHEEGVALIRDWIASFPADICE